MTWLLALSIAALSLSSLSWDQPSNLIVPIQSLVKIPSEMQVGFKHYTIQESEEIGLYGGRHKHFLNDSIYWGEFGYGALTGKRSGYLEGGLLLGVKGGSLFFKGVYPEYSILLGAGGGGSAPQGGGLMINPSIALYIPINPTLGISTECGYIHFINGDISSMTWSVSGVASFWDLGSLE